MEIKIEVEIPEGEFCNKCQFLVNIDKELHCGLFHKDLDAFNSVMKCKKCAKLGKIENG